MAKDVRSLTSKTSQVLSDIIGSSVRGIISSLFKQLLLLFHLRVLYADLEMLSPVTLVD